MKKNTCWLLAVLLMIATSCQSQSFSIDSSRIVANPINLNYQFQPEENSYREAADPVCEYFNGKYYLFASKSGGYWSSPDLCNWTYISCKSITTIDAYAPTVFEYDGMLYYLASGGNPQIFRTSTPDKDNWELIDTKFSYGNTDPSFFLDDDGKVFLYWGCSNEDPIVGVEVDPKDGFKALSTPDTLITHRYKEYGWEAPGDYNEKDENGWNEGPCLIKYKNRYYLQYAAPGTQFRVYADGIYIADHPLGPYTYVESNPFSFKPGGFIGGAGHGHTFKDKYGNYWHVASMKISIRHMFERRLGLFPVYISNDDNVYQHSVFTDYPFRIPDGPTDFEKDNLFMNWNLLSYQKAVSASSSLPDYRPESGNDEQVETWWASAGGNVGEWWQIDLGEMMEVNALQVNFADHDFNHTASSPYPLYQYKIESSDNGSKWEQIVDKTDNTKDAPHGLIVLNKAIKTRFLRITNTRLLDGKFSLSGFRVFGTGNGTPPPIVTDIVIDRNNTDRRMISFRWNKGANATGYIIHWGVKENKLNNALMVFDSQPIYRFFNRFSSYYFTIDSFNE
ncbi:Xylan 1 3-beta-xylosidase, partial [termite gut metagenome]